MNDRSASSGSAICCSSQCTSVLACVSLLTSTHGPDHRPEAFSWSRTAPSARSASGPEVIPTVSVVTPSSDARRPMPTASRIAALAYSQSPRVSYRATSESDCSIIHSNRDRSSSSARRSEMSRPVCSQCVSTPLSSKIGLTVISHGYVEPSARTISSSRLAPSPWANTSANQSVSSTWRESGSSASSDRPTSVRPSMPVSDSKRALTYTISCAVSPVSAALVTTIASCAVSNAASSRRDRGEP